MFALAFVFGIPSRPLAEARETDPPENAKKKDQDKKDDGDKDKEEEEPKLSVTEHTITIGGKPVKYKATAGYMVLKDYSPKPEKKDNHGKDDAESEDKGDEKSDKKPGRKKPKPLAKVFFIAYTRDDAGNPGKRPVTFTYNGGAGVAPVSFETRGPAAPPRGVAPGRADEH